MITSGWFVLCLIRGAKRGSNQLAAVPFAQAYQSGGLHTNDNPMHKVNLVAIEYLFQ